MPQPSVTDWSVYGPLGLIVVVLLGALAWMTLGRFADRDAASKERDTREKEHAKQDRELLERAILVQQEQARASQTHTIALQEMAAAIRQQSEAVDRNTDALNQILREVVRDALRPQGARRTISDATIEAVRELQDPKRERR